MWYGAAARPSSAPRAHGSVPGLQIRRCLADHGGYEVQVKGDAFTIVFPKAIEAVRCAFAIQEELLSEEWPEVRARNGGVPILNVRASQELLEMPEGRAIFKTPTLPSGEPVPDAQQVRRLSCAALPCARRASTLRARCQIKVWRGLRVCMGLHQGEPMFSEDPTTKRLNYFGPMVSVTRLVGCTARDSAARRLIVCCAR